MSRARDDARRNHRRAFALYRNDDDRTPVGSFWLAEADGCEFGYTEFGSCFAGTHSETHEPGSHVLDAARMAHTDPRAA